MSRSKIVLITGICIIAIATLTVVHYSRGEEAKDIPGTNISNEESKNAEQKEKTEDVEMVKSLVTNFGKKLKMVSVLAPEDILIKSIEENYSEYISTALLEKWKQDPKSAPGRLTSSPWPERIEISSLDKISESEYEVRGDIIEVTSTDQSSDEATSKIPILLKVVNDNGKWVIDDVTITLQF